MNNAEFKKQNRQHAANTRDFLASGGLDSIGNDKRFEQRELTFDALEAVLIKYGEILARRTREQLVKEDADASGFLSDSIRFEYTKAGSEYSAAVYMSTYAKFVDEGVQGVDGSVSINRTSPYKFKFIRPSKGHVEALEKWIKDKNVTALVTVPKGITSSLTPLSLAYAIGVSIKKRGLRATNFKSKVVEDIITDFKAEVAFAAGADMKINILF